MPMHEAELEDSRPQHPRRLPPVLVRLLKGVLYRDRDERLWQDFRAFEGAARDYFGKLGLELAVDEAYGFAYLKQAESEDDGIPRLIQRRPLSVHLSILCVLLRKRLAEAEASGEGRAVIPRAQIIEQMRLYWPRRSDEAGMDDRIDQQIRRAVEFDLLEVLDAEPPAYEVRPVVKALVDAEWLSGLDEKLRAYQDSRDAG